MTESRKWLILAAIIGMSMLLYLLAPMLIPFLIAGFLAYMTDPLADRLETYGLSRALAATIVFTGLILFILLLLLIFVPLLERQITTFIAQLPGYVDWLQHKVLPYVQDRLGLEQSSFDLASLQQAITENWQKAGGIMATVIGSLSRSGLTILGWLVNLLLIPVVTFYLLRDWDKMTSYIRSLLPLNVEPIVTRLAQQSDEVLGAFFRGQLLVMVGQGVVYSVGLTLIGLKLALLVGVIAGLISFIPYLGFIVGILIAGIAAFAQFQDPFILIYVFGVFIVGQLTESFLFTPLLIGGRIGLHPVAVIFAVLAGGQLFGFVGILLALPAAAVIRVLLVYVHERYVNSRLYGPQAPS